MVIVGRWCPPKGKETMLFTPIRNSGSSRFCGPTAIAAVTGISGSEVRDAIRQARGDIRNSGGSHMPVAGLSNQDLLAAMAVLGWNVAEDWHEPSRRLSIVGQGIDGRVARPDGFKPLAFTAFLCERGNDGPFIVNVTGHYIAVSHGELCDADTCPLPTEIDRYLARKRPRYAGSWIAHWWRFVQQ